MGAMEVEDMEEEAMVVMEEEEEAILEPILLTPDTMLVEDTIPREAKEADIIPPMMVFLTRRQCCCLSSSWRWSSVVSSFVVIAIIGASILAIARKNANECGNIDVVLFHTSFVKEASFLNRMNYLHGKSIHAQLQCSSIRFLRGDITKSVFLGNSGERVLHYIYLFQFT